MKANFLKDDNGNESITRVAFVYGLLWSTVFTTVYSFTKTVSVGEIIALWNGLSGAFFGLKLGQKWVEKKLDNNKQ
jgi:hypothetical protein